MKTSNPEKGVVLYKNIAWETLSQFLIKKEISKVFIIMDKNTNVHCLPLFLKKLMWGKALETLVIPAGEQGKTIKTCLTLWNKLSKKGADRNSVIINLGGGVVTDLGGFVATTFKRGISFINIPTSLLAMVDASVGGKNGVDLGHIKNQIGTINKPEMVVVDTAFLKTVPKNQIVSGLAEMLKHSLIHSPAYWNKIKNIDITNSIEFEKLIRESIEIKKEIVSKDPWEKNIRKTLNYGHTLGHAIESYSLRNENKTNLLHGEAVAIGIILASHISSEKLGFPKNRLHEITRVFLGHFQKQIFDSTDINEIINLLVYDKKNRNGKVLFVLLQQIGRPRLDCTVPNAMILNAFEYYKNF